MKRANPRGIPQEIIDNRRAAVARLKMHGLSSREIERALGAPVEAGGIRNPDTGKPYDHTTVLRDLKALDAEWKQSAAADTATHKAHQLAEHQEIKRIAARKEDLTAWLKALDQEAKLTGTYAPTKISGADGGPLQVEQTISDALSTKLDAIAERLATAGRGPGPAAEAGAGCPADGVHPAGEGPA